MAEERVDVLILGGGIAGVSCALELNDSRVSYLLLEGGEKLGGQLAEIPNSIKNFAGGFYRDGEELRQALVAVVDKLACRYLLGHPISDAQLAARRIVSGNKVFQAEAIVIATGSRTRTLALPRLDDFRGDIFYRVEGQQERFSGQPVAVVGGADSACLDALALAATCPQVYLIHRGDRLKARPDIIRDVVNQPRITLMLQCVVSELRGTSKLDGVKVVNAGDNEFVLAPVTRLVIQIGRIPNSEPFAGQVKMDAQGHIEVDVGCATNCPGVFAAGDIVAPSYPRIASAVGQGIMAAASCRRFIGNL